MTTLRRLLCPFFILLVLSAALTGCRQKGERPSESAAPSALSGAELARRHCQSCHAFSEPELLNKETWKQTVLPRMGHRLGIYEDGTRPDSLFERGLGGQFVKVANVFPKKPRLSRSAWQKIVDYYVTEAPDEPLPIQGRPKIETGLEDFRVRVPSFRTNPPMTSLVKIGPTEIYVGDVKRDFSTLTILDRQFKTKNRIALKSAPSNLQAVGTDLFVTNMGKLLPTDNPSGRIVKLFFRPGDQKRQSFVTLADSLRRPSHAAYGDLNGDGNEDVVVCEFGFRTGSLSWYENKGAERFERHVLNKRPGAVRAAIHDFNQDGRPDVMALMGQGDEGLYVYYNEEGGFKEERVLRFEASYGSTYFELADFNDDDAVDIVYVNGDNADYYPLMKNYHGVRIFLNDGANNFEERYFYPLNGAYGARTADFDRDGDRDIAVISFFPDYENSPEESFVYLENQGNFTFEASTFEGSSTLGRWIVLDSGDIDQDGDLDLLLGSFTALGLESDYIPKPLLQRWLQEGPSLVFLENTTTGNSPAS